MLQIRDFVAADQAAASAVIQAGMHDRWGNDYDPAFNTDTDDIASSYTTDGNHFVVAATVDNTVVGTGALTVESRGVDAPATARIVRMSVARTHRRQGIARAIVAALLDRARQDGFAHVLVSTDTPWLDAIALYEACGFTRVAADEIDTHLEMPLP